MSGPQRSHTPETCAWCAGTGTRAVSLGYIISCLVCGGKGTVSVAQPSGPCPPCGGRGRRGVTNKCLSCEGTGWARMFAQ
jgi:DnaJ-class molecular chaperone